MKAEGRRMLESKMKMKRVRVMDRGSMGYGEAFKLQMELVKEEKDTLLLLEHPPVITLGRSSLAGNLLITRDELANRGFEIFETNRGGDITYHGPGQLVGYPILRLRGCRRDLHRLVRDYEEVVIRTLEHFGIGGSRIQGLSGVWVKDKKIAAMGVGVKNWTTFHGFSLNVDVDLTPFSYIVPCGIRDRGITSMRVLLGEGVDMVRVKKQVAQSFAEVFNVHLQFPGGNIFGKGCDAHEPSSLD